MKFAAGRNSAALLWKRSPLRKKAVFTAGELAIFKRVPPEVVTCNLVSDACDPLVLPSSTTECVFDADARDVDGESPLVC